MTGLDISRYQKDVDFKKLKVGFVIAKATQGTSWVDPYYYKNQKGCRDNGILFGSYHFADGGDAKKEADWFVKNVGLMQEGEILVLDWEINQSNYDVWCRIFLDRCFELTGVRPLLYTNEARAKMNWSVVVEGNYGLWVARYYLNTGYKPPLVSPSSGQWPFWAIWQYTSRGKVDGITGYVDMNYTKMNLETLKKYGYTEDESEDTKIYPLATWKTASRGYRFGERTWYGTKHLGLDVIVPKGTPVYAWRDVETTFAQYGYQGGYQCHIKDGTKLVRLMHLQELPSKGKFKSGQVLAYTGNTGALTTGAHLHIDCSRNGKLELNNFSNFIDPEEYFA